MDLKLLLLEAWSILQLKEPSIHRVAHDRSTFKPAWLGLAIGALASSFGLLLFPVSMGMFIYRPDFGWILESAVGAVLGTALIFFVVGWVAERLFRSQISAQGFFQVMAYASLVNVLDLVPGLGVITSIWLLIVFGKVLHGEGKLETGPIVLLYCLFLVLLGSFSYSSTMHYGMGF